MTEIATVLGDAVKVKEVPTPTDALPSCFFPSGPITTYSFVSANDPFLVECGRTTSYTVLYTCQCDVQPVGPKLPLGLENLLVAWRSGTGDLAEVPSYAYTVLGLIEPAQYGTRYDLISSAQVPYKDTARTRHSRRQTLAEIWSNPAEELRKITGLPVEELAEVFGVSRVTYHNWIASRPIAL